MFAGVVLAAGASSRFGSPKALIPVEGEAAVARIVRRCTEAGAKETLVVLGDSAGAIRPAVPKEARVVINENWKDGQITSVQAGARLAGASLDVLVWPVDHPAVSLESVKRILAGSKDIRVPVFEGQRGHPALFSKRLRERILGLRKDEPLHTLAHKHPDLLEEIPVLDPGVLLNVNAQADLERMPKDPGGRKRARPLA